VLADLSPTAVGPPTAGLPVPGPVIAASTTAFTPPLVAFVVVVCLLILVVALAISRAKRDVSIDLTVLEVRK